MKTQRTMLGFTAEVSIGPAVGHYRGRSGINFVGGVSMSDSLWECLDTCARDHYDCQWNCRHKEPWDPECYDKCNTDRDTCDKRCYDKYGG